MKALLLSAGLGTRLRPITEKIPKVMVEVNGKPVLQYHIENLKKAGITEIAINTHYMPEKIKEYFGDGKRFGVDITYSYETELLGTSGALNNFKDYFKETFLVVYADVLANFDVEKALKTHVRNKAEATIALDNQGSMKGKGAVVVHGEKVLKFVEKPDYDIPGAARNSGFYVVEPSVIKEIPTGFSDFARDILPKLVEEGKVYSYLHDNYLFDIGTHESLNQAENFLKNFKE